jgi:hypothetical protein
MDAVLQSQANVKRNIEDITLAAKNELKHFSGDMLDLSSNLQMLQSYTG